METSFRCSALVLSLAAFPACSQSVDDVAGDLTVTAHDLAAPSDFAAPPDIAPGPDLIAAADSAATPDSASAPDLAVRPDLRVLPDSAGADLAGVSPCAPGGGCAQGPKCGNVCCNSGEQCDPGTGKCVCGMNGACAVGEMCASGGPIGPGKCGILCCGDPGHPCPL